MGSPDSERAAKRFGQYLRSLKADVAFVAETGLRDGSVQLASFQSIMRQKFNYLVLNHYPINAPKGKGVLIVTRLEAPVQEKSIVRDMHGRGMAATIRFVRTASNTQVTGATTQSVRVLAAYGVTGLAAGATPAVKLSEDPGAWLRKCIHAAAAEDLPILLGTDCNSIADAALDTIGSPAVERVSGLVQQILKAGCEC